MQRFAGLLALLAVFIVTDNLVADHPCQLARRLGFRWSAGYHWQTPGHDSSYYNPWGGYHGCQSCQGQSFHPRINQYFDQNSPGAYNGAQHPTGAFFYPVAAKQQYRSPIHQSMDSYRDGRYFNAQPANNRGIQFDVAPAAHQSGFGFPGIRR